MSQNITSKEIKKYILELEQKYPVNHWRIYGVDVWPYIRIKLYIFLLNLGSNKPKVDSAYSLTKRKHPVIGRLIKAPGSLINALTILCPFFIRLKPKKILFIGSHFHRTKQNGVFFNRLFDAMVDTHQLQDEVYMIEFEKVYEKNYNQKAILPLHKYLDQYKLLKKLEGLFVPPEKVSMKLNGYETFYEELIREFPDARNLNISIEALRHWAQKLNRTKGFFTRLYEKTKPEKIIFLSYYGYDDLAAAILAAHKLGIKTIDFQHGPQTNVHMAYTSWTKHPPRPYNIMPMEYWNWDQKSKENIEEWAVKTKFIQAKLVGHPYLTYCLKDFKKENYKKNIFFSLQTLPLEEMLPPAFLSLIKELDFQWVFRMHPRSNFTQKELEAFLTKSEFKKEIYTIEEASDTPLPQSLSMAQLHVTNFSGCVIEAKMLNIPSIIIHESGKDIFRTYIDDKQVFYLNPYDPDFKERFKHIIGYKIQKNEAAIFRPILNPLEI